jgi:transposase
VFNLKEVLKMVCRTFSRNEVAELLGVSVGTVINMEQEGTLKRLKGVPGVKFNRRDVYAVLNEKEDDLVQMKRLIDTQQKTIIRLRLIIQGMAESCRSAVVKAEEYK